MKTKIVKMGIIGTGIIFFIISFSQLSYGLRTVADDYKDDQIKEVIKNEDIQKKEAIQQREKPLHKEEEIINSSSRKEETKRPQYPRVVKGESDQGKNSNFYILGGIFFLLVILAIVVFIRKLES